MKNQWIEVSCFIAEELADECEQWIGEESGVEPVVIKMAGDDRVKLVCYMDDESSAVELLHAIKRHPDCQSPSLISCEPRDWATFWRTHFYVQEIGNLLAVVPSWEKYNNDKRVALILDPGLSFGTGHHFTTRFCLEMIERLTPERDEGSMWDLGAGSGILSIAAAKLGWSDIDAVDFDPQCLDAMQNNMQLNQLQNRGIRIRMFDIVKDSPARTYELVCANLYDRLLVDYATKISKVAKRWLVLSGIQAHELEHVKNKFQACGFDLLEEKNDQEWGGLCLRKKKGG